MAKLSVQFAEHGKFVQRDRGQLTTFSFENDHIAKGFVVEISIVMQSLSSPLTADDFAHGRRIPTAKSHLHGVLQFNSVARLELLEDA